MRSCSDWWTTTKTNPNIFKRPNYQTDHVEDHLMAWPEIAVASLAADLGLTENQVKAAQRRLGLRKCVENNPGLTGRYALDARGHSSKKR